MLMLVGTYTRNTGSAGIYAYEVDEGCRTFAGSATNAEIDNPSWLVRHPRLAVLYAVNEARDIDGGGAVSAFACDAQGYLKLVDRKPSMGGDPCHLAIDADGTRLLVSNYTGGNFASFALAPDGTLGDLASLVQHAGRGVDPMRQKGPHVHSITLDKSGNAYVADLGLDQVLRYPLGANGSIKVEGRKTIRLKPGAGPRMLAFDSQCRYGYVIDELDNTIVCLARDTSGDLVELATYSALPADFTDASYCSHIEVSADDRFLYASNRGHDSIAVFHIGEEGALTLVQHESSRGRHPRHFTFSPDQRFLLVANRDDNNIVVFARDPASGKLTFTGTELTVPAPVCIRF